MTTTTTARAPRLAPVDRAAAILDAAVTVAQKLGWVRFTRSEVAVAAGVSPALVTHYYPADELRAAVMQHAIDKRLLRIVAEGVTNRDPQAMSAPDTLRAEALQWIAVNH